MAMNAPLRSDLCALLRKAAPRNPAEHPHDAGHAELVAAGKKLKLKHPKVWEEFKSLFSAHPRSETGLRNAVANLGFLVQRGAAPSAREEAMRSAVAELLALDQDRGDEGRSRPTLLLDLEAWLCGRRLNSDGSPKTGSEWTREREALCKRNQGFRMPSYLKLRGPLPADRAGLSLAKLDPWSRALLSELRVGEACEYCLSKRQGDAAGLRRLGLEVPPVENLDSHQLAAVLSGQVSGELHRLVGALTQYVQLQVRKESPSGLDSELKRQGLPAPAVPPAVCPERGAALQAVLAFRQALNQKRAEEDEEPGEPRAADGPAPFSATRFNRQRDGDWRQLGPERRRAWLLEYRRRLQAYASGLEDFDVHRPLPDYTPGQHRCGLLHYCLETLASVASLRRGGAVLTLPPDWRREKARLSAGAAPTARLRAGFFAHWAAVRRFAVALGDEAALRSLRARAMGGDRLTEGEWRQLEWQAQDFRLAGRSELLAALSFWKQLAGLESAPDRPQTPPAWGDRQGALLQAQDFGLAPGGDEELRAEPLCLPDDDDPEELEAERQRAARNMAAAVQLLEQLCWKALLEGKGLTIPSLWRYVYEPFEACLLYGLTEANFAALFDAEQLETLDEDLKLLATEKQLRRMLEQTPAALEHFQECMGFLHPYRSDLLENLRNHRLWKKHIERDGQQLERRFVPRLVFRRLVENEEREQTLAPFCASFVWGRLRRCGGSPPPRVVLVFYGGKIVKNLPKPNASRGSLALQVFGRAHCPYVVLCPVARLGPQNKMGLLAREILEGRPAGVELELWVLSSVDHFRGQQRVPGHPDVILQHVAPEELRTFEGSGRLPRALTEAVTAARAAWLGPEAGCSPAATPTPVDGDGLEGFLRGLSAGSGSQAEALRAAAQAMAVGVRHVVVTKRRPALLSGLRVAWLPDASRLAELRRFVPGLTQVPPAPSVRPEAADYDAALYWRPTPEKREGVLARARTEVSSYLVEAARWPSERREEVIFLQRYEGRHAGATPEKRLAVFSDALPRHLCGYSASLAHRVWQGEPCAGLGERCEEQPRWRWAEDAPCYCDAHRNQLRARREERRVRGVALGCQARGCQAVATRVYDGASRWYCERHAELVPLESGGVNCTQSGPLLWLPTPPTFKEERVGRRDYYLEEAPEFCVKLGPECLEVWAEAKVRLAAWLREHREVKLVVAEDEDLRELAVEAARPEVRVCLLAAWAQPSSAAAAPQATPAPSRQARGEAEALPLHLEELLARKCLRPAELRRVRGLAAALDALLRKVLPARSGDSLVLGRSFDCDALSLLFLVAYCRCNEQRGQGPWVEAFAAELELRHASLRRSLLLTADPGASGLVRAAQLLADPPPSRRAAASFLQALRCTLQGARSSSERAAVLSGFLEQREAVRSDALLKEVRRRLAEARSSSLGLHLRESQAGVRRLLALWVLYFAASTEDRLRFLEAAQTDEMLLKFPLDLDCRASVGRRLSVGL